MAADLAIATLTNYHKLPRVTKRTKVSSSSRQTVAPYVTSKTIAKKLIPDCIQRCCPRIDQHPYERLLSDEPVLEPKKDEEGEKNRWIQEWINKSTPSPFISNKKEEEEGEEEEEEGQRVIVQVFVKDILLKSEIKELSQGGTVTLFFENTEQDLTSKVDSSSILVPRAHNLNQLPTMLLDRGLSIHCSNQKAFVWCPGGRACFVGDRKDWRDISLNATWEEVNCSLDNVEPCPMKEEPATLEHNSATSCEDNVVRMAIGCQPQTRIYDTDFHVKLSFWSRKRH